MDITLIALAILAFSILYAAYKLITKGFKLFAFASLLFSLTLFISGLLLYLDIRDFQENFQDSEKIFLLSENGNILTGFTSTLQEGSEPDEIPKERLAELQTYYNNKEYNKIKGENYKMFIIDASAFDFMEEEQEIEREKDFVYTKEFVFKFIKSENLADDFSREYIKQKSIDESRLEEIKKEFIENIEEDKFRAQLFSSLLEESSKQKGPLFLILFYREGDTLIYKETILFKLIKLLPEGIMEKLPVE